MAQPRQRSWTSYRRLISFTRPYRKRLIFGAAFCALFAGGNTGMIAAVRKFVSTVFSYENRALGEVAAVGGLLIGMGALRGIGDFIGRYLIQWVGNRVVMDLRIAMFDHLQRLSLAFFTRRKTGELISRLSNDAAQVEHAVAQVLTDLFKQPFVLIGTTFMLFWLNAPLALGMVVVFPLCVLPIYLFGRRVRRAATQSQEQLGDVLSVAQEAITGARIVKAFGMEDYERERFAHSAGQVFRRVMQVARTRAAIEPVIVQLGVVCVVLVLIYAWKVRMSVDNFFAFALALMLFYDPVKRLGSIHVTIQQSSAAADRIFELLDTPIRIRDRPDAVVFDEPVREVRFDDVGFDYGDGPVLSGVRFAVPSGRRLAIVGSSGSGKSTLVSLLPRFFDVTAGRILINDRDIRDFTVASLRRRMALVTQETILFNDTIANNIAYGAPERDRAAIEDAARRAHADGFIRRLPQGYETNIGDRGVRLSGGERQRIAIARALLRDAPILILDEATSALDTESERLVQAALDELMAHRTVFVIAHRLSTIIGADDIIVLDGGRIVEQGSHTALLERGGVYRRLYDLQFET